MSHRARHAPSRWSGPLSVACGGIVAFAGVLVLAGWQFDIPALKHLVPGVVSMKANTALAFMLAGLALVFEARPAGAGDEPRWPVDPARVAPWLAALVLLIGGLTLGEYLFGWQLGLDELLWADDANAIATVFPGRMAPATAICFMLLGLALVRIAWEPRRGFRPAELLAVGAVVLSLRALMGYVGGVLTPYGFSQYTAMAPQTAFGCVLLSIGVLYARPALGMMGMLRAELHSARARASVGIMALALLATLAGGFWFYFVQERRVRREVEERLEAIARLKLEQLVQWRDAMAAAAEVLIGNPVFANDAARFLAAPRPAARELFLAQFRVLQRFDEFSDVRLLDARGRTRLSSVTPLPVLHAETEGAMATAAATRHPVLTDLHAAPDDTATHIEVVAPVFAARARAAPPIGFVIMAQPYSRQLAPLIESWPTASRSAETLLLRRDGDVVVFVSELRHSSGSLLRLRIPLTRREVPAVMGALGHRGVFYGTDYRGVRVLSVLHPVPASSWFMVAKVDDAEAFALWRFRARAIAAVIALLVLALMFAARLFWMREDRFGKLARSVEALRESETRFRLVVEHAKDLAMIMLDADGRIASWNVGAERIMGYRAEEIVGQHVGRLCQPTDAGGVTPEQALTAAAADGRLEGEVWQVRKDGSRFLARLVVTALRDSTGMLRGYARVTEDLTERKRAAALQEGDSTVMRMVATDQPLADTLGALALGIEKQIDGALCSVLLLDADGLHLRHGAAPRLPAEYNRAVDGVPIGPAAGSCGTAAFRRQPVIVTDIETDPLWAACRSLAAPHGLRACWSTPIIRSDGRVLGTFALYWREPHKPAVEDQSVVAHGVNLARIAIERTQGQETLRRSNETLEAKVAERTSELQQANARLDRVSRLKDEFLANMSHELRTPLNSILGLSETLIEQLADTVTPRQAKSLTTISTSGQHLLALINDILDLSKIEAGMLELMPSVVPMQDFCDSCLAFVRTQAMAKHLSVDVSIDPRLSEFEADQRRFKQVLVNLLSNAVKFTPAGGRIGLDVDAPEGEDVVRFAVWDTGVGIAATDFPRLFLSFSQLDSGLSRAEQGTGLGLALVAKLVELHGGSVSLQSEPGQGSRFTVTLPRVIGPAVREPEPAVASGAVRPVYSRALLIEDDATAVEILTGYLTELGIASVSHGRGELALEAALREHPDVILLDILLPGESGWGVLERLKAHPGTQHIPVVVISVVDNPRESFAKGAVAHFTKPVTRAQLAEALLPRVETAGRWTPAPAEPRPAGGGPRILLAEDNAANIETIGGYLEYRGYDLQYAMNGLVAVKIARELLPALIVMDIQMPVMDGLTAIREIRADASLRDIPIIALTALAMPGDRERCLEAGATEYMTKPANLKALAALVARLVPA